MRGQLRQGRCAATMACGKGHSGTPWPRLGHGAAARGRLAAVRGQRGRAKPACTAARHRAARVQPAVSTTAAVGRPRQRPGTSGAERMGKGAREIWCSSRTHFGGRFEGRNAGEADQHVGEKARPIFRYLNIPILYSKFPTSQIYIMKIDF